MTEYTDVPKVNALHAESQLVAQAIANIEAGGTLSSMMISPPPLVPYDPDNPPPPPSSTTLPPMPVNVTVPPPVDAALLADITAWLNQRLVDITAELEALGVTVPPAGDPQWSARMPYGGYSAPPPISPPPISPMPTRRQ
jgi:hypothetical protein